MQTGGLGKDSFVFSTRLSAATNVDRINDFSVPNDTIHLENAIFHGIAAGHLAATAFYKGVTAHDANDRIIYNEANGWLTYDSNGNQAGGAAHFATLAPHLTVISADFFVILMPRPRICEEAGPRASTLSLDTAGRGAGLRRTRGIGGGHHPGEGSCDMLPCRKGSFRVTLEAAVDVKFSHDAVTSALLTS